MMKTWREDLVNFGAGMIGLAVGAVVAGAIAWLAYGYIFPFLFGVVVPALDGQ